MVITFLVLFFMRIPKLVSELCFTEFWFLTSREVRSGLFLTFDPNFDPLRMINTKKEDYFLMLLFWEESKSAIRIWFWPLWNFDPRWAGLILVIFFTEPVGLAPQNLTEPERKTMSPVWIICQISQSYQPRFVKAAYDYNL